MKYNSIIVASFLLIITIPLQLYAGQCDHVPDYDYRNGHRAVQVGDYLPRSIAENVTFCADADVPSLWKTAAQSGISRLNYLLSNSNSHLRVSYSTGSSCTFDIQMSYSLPSGTYAAINEPVTPGYTAILINANYTTMPGFPYMEHIMMHEVLHTVGVGHTGMDNYPWVEVPNTDGYYDDYYAGLSLMCKGGDPDVDNPLRHLNFLDQRTLDIMYPK